jgi:SAM-dependent methyltransferase
MPANGSSTLGLRASIVAALRCPTCRGELHWAGRELACSPCSLTYPLIDGQIDLRPQHTTERDVHVVVEPPGAEGPAPLPAPLPQGPYPAIAYDTADPLLSCGNRLSPTLTTYLPPAGADDLLLDLGSGNGRVGGLLAKARGYVHVPVDYDGPAPILADAMALPLADGSVASCVTFAVFEHLRVPALAAAEVFRVLRPGGVVIGTVAFLEAFHMESYFHHTHLGTRAVLADAGFDPVLVEANADWLGPDALFEMTRLKDVARWRAWPLRLAEKAMHPTFGLSRRKLTDRERLATITAGFRFVATKPA